MELKHINAILMKMGGERCRKSHLSKHYSEAEINQAIREDYILEEKNGEEVFIIKTEKGKKIW